MIRVLLSLLLLEVCVGQADPRTSFGKSSSARDESLQRVVRDVAEPKSFGAKGNYLSTVIYIDLPHFCDFIDVGFVSDKTENFSILFQHIQFSKLSSAFSLSYRIDLDANVVQLLLRLSKAQINGSYCLSTPSLPNTVYDDFELNLYANLIYVHAIMFHIDEKGMPVFGKPEHPHLFYKKIKGRYNNVPKPLAADLDNYLSVALLDAIVDKIYEEVRAKIELDDVALQIRNEIAFRYRNNIAARLKKAIADAFEDVFLNCFNIFYYDRTNFHRIIHNFDVSIPTFVLRDIETFTVQDTQISYAEDNVHAKVVFRIASPLALMRVVYRDANDPQALNHTVKAEYQFSDSSYEFEMIAKPNTETVELGNVAVHVSGVKAAPSQGIYGDARDLIINQLTPYMKTFYSPNGEYVFASYLKGFVAEGRIAYDVFKK